MAQLAVGDEPGFMTLIDTDKPSIVQQTPLPAPSTSSASSFSSPTTQDETPIESMSSSSSSSASSLSLPPSAAYWQPNYDDQYRDYDESVQCLSSYCQHCSCHQHRWLPPRQACQTHFHRSQQLSLSSEALSYNQAVTPLQYWQHERPFFGVGHPFPPIPQQNACHSETIATLIAQAKKRFPRVLARYLASKELEPGMVNTSSSPFQYSSFHDVPLVVHNLPTDLDEKDVIDMFSICTHHDPSPEYNRTCPDVVYSRSRRIPTFVNCCSPACAELLVQLWDRKARFYDRNLRVAPKSSKTPSRNSNPSEQDAISEGSNLPSVS